MRAALLLFLLSFSASAAPTLEVDPYVERFFRETGATATSVAVFQKGKWVFQKNYGAATDQSLYDLASLTKAVATTSVILSMVDRGWAKVNDPVVVALPEFASCKTPEELVPGYQSSVTIHPPISCEKKKVITVEQLMRHRGGLRDFVPLDAVKLAKSKKIAPVELYVKNPLTQEPNGEYRYADINFIVLRAWAEKVLASHGKDYGSFLSDGFKSLQMSSTLLMSPSFQDITRLIPTLKNGRRGAIHDPTAETLGAAHAGHAGLFSTIEDLKKFVEFWMGARKATPPIFSDSIRESATKAPTSLKREEARGLGWDLTTPTSASARGPMEKGFGHTGYTGTSIWIEPHAEIAVIILTNRTYLKSDAQTAGPTNELRKKIANLVWNSIQTKER